MGDGTGRDGDEADRDSDGSPPGDAPTGGPEEPPDPRRAPVEAGGDGTEGSGGEASDAGADPDAGAEGDDGDAADGDGAGTEADDAAPEEDDADDDGDAAHEEAGDDGWGDVGATVSGDDLSGAATDDAEGGGPREDEELPLTAHIEELLKRALVVMIVVSVVSVATFPFGEEIINLLWESSLPGVDTRPRLYSPLELVITQVKVASLAGVVIALPVLVYQSYRFMRPGLYPHERRYYLAAVPTSLVLAFVGLVFGYFVMLPTIFTYFYSYSKDVADIAFALGQTFDLILVLLGVLAVVFQIPLFIMLALMMGLVTREWMARRRLIFWGAFLGVSMLFSPDPTGMAPFILTATMIVLFEGTLQLAKWTKRGRERFSRA
jgi:sec-independent protein translocase protein TatC